MPMDRKVGVEVSDAVDAIPDTGSQGQALAQTTVSDRQNLDSGFEDDAVNDLLTNHGEEEYRMDHRFRGKAVVLCNTKFDPSLKLSDRGGTDKDTTEIQRVFGSILGFDVINYSQLRAHEMVQRVAAAVRGEDNKDMDCFALFVLTHGEANDTIYGTDGPLLISKLVESVKKSPHLAEKPKMLFLQSCRGKKTDRGQHVPDDGDGKDQNMLIPIEADFLYVYSTADGYVSFQNPKTGSWFIQTLCREMANNWQRLDMMQMLTRVTRSLAYNFASYTPSHPVTHNLKQVSSVTTTLTKSLRFTPPRGRP